MIKLNFDISLGEVGSDAVTLFRYCSGWASIAVGRVVVAGSVTKIELVAVWLVATTAYENSETKHSFWKAILFKVS